MKELHTELDWQNRPVPPDEKPDTIIKIWVIVPGAIGFDETWIRSYGMAVEFAQERLAQAVDDADEEDAKEGVGIAMQLREVTLEQYREVQENDE